MSAIRKTIMAYRLISPVRLGRLLQVGSSGSSHRHLSIQKLQRKFPDFERFLSEFRVYFAEKPPKGFEKYFKPKSGDKNAKPPEGKASEKKANTSEAKKPPVSEPPPTSTGGTARPGPSPPRPPGDPWSSFLGGGGPRLGGPAGKGPGGGMGGEGGDKMIFMAVVGTIVLLGTFTYYEMSYTEITWKDFVNT